MKNKTSYVIFDGPFPNTDYEWEYPEWVVQRLWDDGNEDEPSTFRSFNAARAFAVEMSKKLGVELVIEAMRS